MTEPVPSPGELLWSYLPAVVRDADDVGHDGGPPDLLRDYVESIAGMVEPSTYTLAQGAAGHLTDAALTPAALVPWLAQALGVDPFGSEATVRARIAARAEAPATGSRSAIAASARQFLIGERQVLIGADPPWGIKIGVRPADRDITLAALAAKVVATGVVPAGYVLEAVDVLASWAAVEAGIGGTWAGAYGSWSRIEAFGVDLG